MAWVDILPGFEVLVRKGGYESAASFLGWTGVLVNKHRNREVEQVELESAADTSFFLKKEHAVSWRDRVRNTWHGFGWCSTAVREARLLRSLREAGIGCPELAAFGEDGRHAFVLLRDHSDMIELRKFMQGAPAAARSRIAVALGRALARMHAAGFEHRDLFAKHILVSDDGAAPRFCILDWQRGRQRHRVSWSRRCRDLAVLDATLHDALASGRARVRCLRAYLQTTPNAPPLGRLARRIRALAERLHEDRNIREAGQLPVPAADQQFVQACDGRLLIVTSFHDRLGGRIPDWLAGPVDANFTHAVWSEGLTLHTWQHTGSTWEIPELAHTLFRLQRFGVSAPRLCAVGCAGTHVFLLTEKPVALRFDQALAKAAVAERTRLLQEAGRVIRQIHEAGYSLPAKESWSRCLGVDRTSGAIALVKVEPLQRASASWMERGPAELNRQKIRLTRAEQMRFLRGYLRHLKTTARERQVA
jgi:tRNA A-37 threonylcarbamoyl transferase component Bud32